MGQILFVLRGQQIVGSDRLFPQALSNIHVLEMTLAIFIFMKKVFGLGSLFSGYNNKTGYGTLSPKGKSMGQYLLFHGLRKLWVKIEKSSETMVAV
jgi:hypothetical protein